MIDKTEIKARLEFRKEYLALVDGGVKSYTIDDRQLTRLDLRSLKKEIEETEAAIDELTALASEKKPRKAFGIIPRDW